MKHNLYDVICYEIETLSCFVENSCFTAVRLALGEVADLNVLTYANSISNKESEINNYNG